MPLLILNQNKKGERILYSFAFFNKQKLALRAIVRFVGLTPDVIELIRFFSGLS